MCLAYHTKDQCNIKCPCLADYFPYTSSEYTYLVTWCSECYGSWSLDGSGFLGSLVNSIHPYNIMPTSTATTLLPPQLHMIHLVSMPVPLPFLWLLTSLVSKRCLFLQFCLQLPRGPPISVASEVPTKLSEYIACDVKLLQQLRWKYFFQIWPIWSNFSDLLCNIHHPAAHLRNHYKHHGAPVKFSNPPWTKFQIRHTLCRGL